MKIHTNPLYWKAVPFSWMQADDTNNIPNKGGSHDSEREVLRSVIRGASTKTLISMLAEELSDKVLQELIVAKQRKKEEEHSNASSSNPEGGTHGTLQEKSG